MSSDYITCLFILWKSCWWFNVGLHFCIYVTITMVLSCYILSMTTTKIICYWSMLTSLYSFNKVVIWFYKVRNHAYIFVPYLWPRSSYSECHWPLLFVIYIPFWYQINLVPGNLYFCSCLIKIIGDVNTEAETFTNALD